MDDFGKTSSDPGEIDGYLDTQEIKEEVEDFDKTQNICRICLVKNNEEIQCVFDTIKCTREPKQLSEMLMEFAKVEIISGDELPDQICLNCAQNTIKLYLFKIKCEESDKTLRNRLGENPFIVIDKIEIDEENILDKLKSEIKRENVEELHDVLKDNSSDLIENNHLETFVYEDDDSCPSPKHNKSLIKTTTNSTEESFESQENDALHRNKVAEIAHKIKMIDQTLDCEEHEINGKHKSKKRRLISEKNLYKCDNCKIIFPRSTSLAKHKCAEKEQTSSLITQKSADEKLYKCDVCEKTFQHQYLLTSHKRVHTGEKPFECNDCERKFAHVSSLIAHKRTHTGEKPYKCDVCKNNFTQLSSLVAHKRVHTGERPYECDVCKKTFAKSRTLIVHKRSHTDEELYKCDICEKKFKYSSSLVAHKRTHTGEKPFECDICEKKFALLSTCIYHKRTHTGEKPYKCDVCEKKFIQPGALTSHKRTHTGEKPYECDLCENKYSESNSLSIHKRTAHSGGKLYECDVCDKKFKKLSSVDSHCKRFHSDKKNSINV